MRTLFLRIATVLFLTLLIGLLLIVFVGVSAYLDRLVQQHVSTTERVHPILVQELRNAQTSEWPTIIDRQKALLGYEIDIVDRPSANASLPPLPDPEDGSSVRKYVDSTFKKDTVTTWWPIAGDDPRWIRYSRSHDTEFEREDILLLALLFVALPVVLYLNLRPFARKITDLSNVARAYTVGQLDVRSEVPAPKPLEQLTEDIHKMADALKFKIQEQKVMTSAISHELKTPLTRMRMGNDLALREDDPAAWRKHLIDLDDDLNMLEKVIAETLTLSKLTLQDTPLRVCTVPLQALIDQCVSEISPDDPSIEIAISPDTCVLANRDALKRVVTNILQNAIRYRRQRVRIAVTSQDDRWIMTIDDDGPGVPEKDRDKVFMPFGRAENSRSRTTGSTGIGLAIASLLVEKCGGTIWLSDAPLGGARFHIAMPAADKVSNKT